MMNFELVKDTLLGNHTFEYRVNLLVALLGGMWTAMSGFGLFILVLTAFLTGINLTLLAQRISIIKNSGKLKLTVGGGSALALVGSGCASCGLPVLALLGLSGSIIYLPFRGTELSMVAVGLLAISLYFMLKSNSKKIACTVNLGANI